MSISSPGLGSGIDVSNLITELVAAEGQAKANRLNVREAEYQADISAYGSLSGALSLFHSAVQDLQDVADFQARSATSSNEDIFTATATDSAAASQYDIEVVRLAEAHKLITLDGYQSTDAIGGGTITFTQGTDTFNINVTATDTLEDVRDAVNAAQDNTGVIASVLNVDDGLGGTEQKLVFTASFTGEVNEITITVDDDDGMDADNAGLSRLVNANMEETSQALDAQIRVDNQLISSATNDFDNVITGVSISAISVGADERLNVTEDTGAVSSKINTFITNFNGLADVFNALGSYNSETESAGILLGDATLRTIENTVRREISTSVRGLTGAFSTLAELGITTDENGRLNLDEDQLNEVLSSDFDQVGELFAASNGIANNLDSILDGYLGSGGILESRTDGIQNSIDDINDQRLALDNRLLSLESRLLAQFTAMDTLVSTLQNQSTFLTQQLANLPGSYNPNRTT